MSKKEFTDIDKQNEDIANAVARENGYTNIQEMTNDIRNNLDVERVERIVRENNPTATEGSIQAQAKTIVEKAQSRVAQLVSSLTRKVLYQEIESTPLFSYTSFGNRFDDEPLAIGNSKEFVFSLDTGVSSYDRTEYVPRDSVKPLLKSQIVNMYKDVDAQGNAILEDYAYQFRKRVSIAEQEYLPFFKRGALNEFLNKQREKMRKAYSFFKFDQIAGLITATAIFRANKAGAVEGHDVGGYLKIGNAKNVFEAVAKDLHPIFQDLLKGDGHYAIGGPDYNECLVETPASDIMVIMNEKVEAIMSSGVASQLYHPDLWKLDKIIKQENIVTLGNKFVIGGAKQFRVDDVNNPTMITHNLTAGNEDTVITKENEKYVPENLIIIFNKQYLKHMNQIIREGSQYYVSNLYDEHYLHVWALFTFLKWCPFIVYKNDNLTTIPVA